MANVWINGSFFVESSCEKETTNPGLKDSLAQPNQGSREVLALELTYCGKPKGTLTRSRLGGVGGVPIFVYDIPFIQIVYVPFGFWIIGSNVVRDP